MPKNNPWLALSGILVLVLLALALQTGAAGAQPLAQLPTVSIPTVTGTPPGAIARVTREYDQINVRGGPGMNYPEVGVLIAGQEVPAIGRSVGGDWVQIAYPGVPGGIAWVYAYLVDLSAGVPLVPPPPTPTPRTTPTVDPTLAAQFLVEIPPTRLPTFTAPPPVGYPTYPAQAASGIPARIPAGLLISALGALGLFGLLISILRGR